ncbi:aromatic ring-hydroxylating oxygenase subunit alpha [Paraburkholderia aromaticivorans]|uniref:aromatic ring-hydroxylating oxygenase subunit alpha n=1 Tax=Paraburkholderia aromaticivorans TaxID=2026199 RepID=UPI0014561D30|nr:SRPBCC family protein [Paraburkholderia aromaticivorans]
METVQDLQGSSKRTLPIHSTEEIRQMLGTKPVNLDIIRDPAVYRQEQEKIFRRTWLKVATTWEVANPGDWKVKELAVCDASVIIARGKDGVIRAFHNVCTHRGNKVIPTTEFETFGHSRANVMTCRFHGWVFGTNGDLRSVPMKEEFAEIDTKCLSLREIQCDVWEGFVFINFDRKPEQSLKEYLGGFGELFAGYPYAESTTAYRYSTVLDCNWKVALYAFSEGYHVPTIHAGSLPGFSGIEHTNYRILGPHASSAIYGGGMDTADSTQKFATLLHGAETHKPHPEQLPSGINPAGRSDFQFELPSVFPNFIIHLASGCGYPGLSYFTHQFWPLGHGKTLWEGINYFKPAQNAAEDIAQRHVNALHRNAWLEDTATMEDTFFGIMSGAIDEMHLMDREFLIRHGVETLNRYLSEVEA